jgi:hypothetical protein
LGISIKVIITASEAEENGALPLFPTSFEWKIKWVRPITVRKAVGRKSDEKRDLNLPPIWLVKWTSEPSLIRNQ